MCGGLLFDFRFILLSLEVPFENLLDRLIDAGKGLDFAQDIVQILVDRFGAVLDLLYEYRESESHVRTADDSRDNGERVCHVDSVFKKVQSIPIIEVVVVVLTESRAADGAAGGRGTYIL